MSLRAASALFGRCGVRGIALAILLCVSGIAVSSASAQDLGEIARQERAKKQNQDQSAPATHVYTNDDLPKHNILTPEDKSRFDAARAPEKTKADPSAAANSEKSLPKTVQPKISGTSALNAGIIAAAVPFSVSISAQTQVSASALPTAPAPVSVKIAQPVATPIPTVVPVAAPTVVPFDQMPLGDVARYYRAQKQQQAQANAAKVAAAVPAPVSVAAPASASAKTEEPVATPVPIAAPVAVPTAVPLDQMPLGDVARYYRAQKQQQAQANAAFVANSNAAPQASSTTSLPLTASFPMPVSFPMTVSFQMKIGAAPLAAMKSTPKNSTAISPAVPNSIVKATPAPGMKMPAPRIAAPTVPVRSTQMRDPFARPSRTRLEIVRPTQTRLNIVRPSQMRQDFVRSPAAPSRSISPAVRLAPIEAKVVPPAAKTLAVAPLRPKPIAPIPVTGKPLVLGTSPARPYGVNLPVSVRVASGDTLWTLARKFLGSGTRWQELIALNPGIQDPRRLRAGMQLVLRSPAG